MFEATRVGRRLPLKWAHATLQHCIITTLRCTTFEVDRGRLQWTRPNKSARTYCSPNLRKSIKTRKVWHIHTCQLAGTETRKRKSDRTPLPTTTTHQPHLVSRGQQPVMTTQSSVPVVHREVVRHRGEGRRARLHVSTNACAGKC